MAIERFEARLVVPGDRDEWEVLFSGYADFYRVAIDRHIADTVFGWLLDPGHVLEGLIARGTDGAAVGIAHVRACPRPLAGCEIGFLDDLFVDPKVRGSGVADVLFEALAALGRERGWSAIRWLTQHFNARGRAFYDRYTGGPSDFIAYHWNLGQPASS